MKKILMIALIGLIGVAFVGVVFAQAPAGTTEKKVTTTTSAPDKTDVTTTTTAPDKATTSKTKTKKTKTKSNGKKSTTTTKENTVETPAPVK